jgi:adenosylcobyric acid synthase
MTRRPPALMLQATGSHAGKTVLVAGLCRLFARNGIRALPFKSQNMSLNAWVTRDGKEMGWAQAMQAEAAGVPARVEMNPVLLKPAGEARSQLVVLGRVRGTYTARQYYALGPRLWHQIVAAYERLAGDAGAILIEGAGSPAEPNLMRRDLANMRVARMARARVIVVGDIDRGGVFASLVGTMTLLRAADRARVAGFVLNRFRGDPALLASAISDLRRRTGRPVLGVVPHLAGLRLPEEDSVALEGRRERDPAELQVAVIRLPRIANFTDFAPLEDDGRFRVVYAERPGDLAGARLVVLPGSKDTIADLRALEARGFGPALSAHAARGGAIVGICGGYQMLGRRIEDPDGVESGGSAAGLGLLPVSTRLSRKKTTRRVHALWLPAGPEVEAYEIHMGETVAEGPGRPAFAVSGAGAGATATDGWVAADERVLGTYLHGLFESAASRRKLLDWARRSAAALGAPGEEHRAQRGAVYDAIADALETAIGLRRLLGLLGL